MKKNLLPAASSVLLIVLLFSTLNVRAWTDRNILSINIISADKILVQGELLTVDQIKDRVKSFLSIPLSDDDYLKAEYRDKQIESLGVVTVSKGVVAVQCSRTVEYGFYIAVNNEIEKAYNELRNEFSLKVFKVDYLALTADQQEAVKIAIPKRLSEAEPNFVWREGKLVYNNAWSWCF